MYIFISESFHSELKGQPDVLRRFFQAVSIIPSTSQSWFPGSRVKIFSRFSSFCQGRRSAPAPAHPFPSHLLCIPDQPHLHLACNQRGYLSCRPPSLDRLMCSVISGVAGLDAPPDPLSWFCCNVPVNLPAFGT